MTKEMQKLKDGREIIDQFRIDHANIDPTANDFKKQHKDLEDKRNSDIIALGYLNLQDFWEANDYYINNATAKKTLELTILWS